ncbi:MAG: hypothetical protein WDW38_003179 [Sanguina aurantia]
MPSDHAPSGWEVLSSHPLRAPAQLVATRTAHAAACQGRARSQTAHQSSGHLADACCLHVQRLILSLSPRGVLTLLSAHSKLRHHGSVVLQDLVYLAEAFMAEFWGRDFSALAHALGTLRLRPPGREWMAAFWRHSQGRLPGCSARELSTMLWGLGEWRWAGRDTTE